MKLLVKSKIALKTDKIEGRFALISISDGEETLPAVPTNCQVSLDYVFII